MIRLKGMTIKVTTWRRERRSVWRTTLLSIIIHGSL